MEDLKKKKKKERRLSVFYAESCPKALPSNSEELHVFNQASY